MIRGYEKRDIILLEMGFGCYAEYLQSDLWKSIRASVLERDRHTCRLCGDRAWQVHHRNYQRGALDGSKTWNLLSVCRNCHENLEFDEYGRKLSPTEVDEIFRRLAKACGKCKVCGSSDPLKSGICKPCHKAISQPWKKLSRPRPKPLTVPIKGTVR